MLEITKQRHIVGVFCNSIQWVLLLTICPRRHTLTFMKFTRVVDSRLASVERTAVRCALPGSEIDAPASEFSETTCVEAWEASRARDVCFGEDSGVGIVE